MQFETVEIVSDAQIQELTELYWHQWWSKDRKAQDVKRMIQNTDVAIALYDPEKNRLAAFARILTDFTYRALLLDVIVEGSYTGTGLGQKVMDKIMEHPKLQEVEEFVLF